MSKPQRSRINKLRASFGRAERLQREVADDRVRAKPSRKQTRADQGINAPKQERTRSERGEKPTPAFTRAAAWERKMTALDTVTERVERVRGATERQRQLRLKEQTRTAFNRQAERRRDTTRRTDQERQRQATLKRTEDTRRRHAQKTAERKRDNMRRAFNREADRRRDAARRIEHERIRRRATVEIERRHKQQLADQQTEHRRQTSEVRMRHQAETRSMRSNETVALERHHHAVKGIDDREARVLDDFVGRRTGLVGRFVERIPGQRQAKDQQEAEIRRGFEAERLTKHRDLEALKERQFKLAQDTRINQAKERKASMDGHRTERTHLAERQKADRPRQIEGQTRALTRVERDRSREVEQVRKGPERERLSLSFGRA